jgi:hypothetical protein
MVPSYPMEPCQSSSAQDGHTAWSWMPGRCDSVTGHGSSEAADEHLRVAPGIH